MLKLNIEHYRSKQAFKNRSVKYFVDSKSGKDAFSSLILFIAVIYTREHIQTD